MIPTNHQQAAAAAAIMPTAQPLLLNQMPMLTAPGVQFILRPQTATKIQPQVQATPQGLILQPAGGGQQLLQIHQPTAAARSQPMVRVLTNGMQLAPSSTTTYVTQVGCDDIRRILTKLFQNCGLCLSVLFFVALLLFVVDNSFSCSIEFAILVFGINNRRLKCQNFVMYLVIKLGKCGIHIFMQFP